jgi:hypothetical protein
MNNTIKAGASLHRPFSMPTFSVANFRAMPHWRLHHQIAVFGFWFNNRATRLCATESLAAGRQYTLIGLSIRLSAHRQKR